MPTKTLVVVSLACCVMAGCATVNEMAMEKGDRAIEPTTKSILLMTVDVSRSDGSRFVPNPFVVKIEKPNAQSKEDRQNFKLDKDADTVKDEGRTIYLARMALEPGQYKLGDVTGDANAFPINSLFVIPLLLDLTVKPNSIAYIGRITAKLRPRQEGEFRAGPVIPLIDQSITGMSTGTWDVTVDDMSQKDIALFRATFPALAAAHIESTPLRPFDRLAVQRWLDGQRVDEQKTLTVPSSQSPGSR